MHAKPAIPPLFHVHHANSTHFLYLRLPVIGGIKVSCDTIIALCERTGDDIRSSAIGDKNIY